MLRKTFISLWRSALRHLSAILKSHQKLFKAAAEKLPTCWYKLDRPVMMAISSESTVFACVIIADDLCGSAVGFEMFLSPAVARCPFLSCTGSPQSMWGEQRMPSSQRPTTASTSSSKSLSSTWVFLKSHRWPSRSDTMRERFPHSLK